MKILTSMIGAFAVALVATLSTTIIQVSDAQQARTAEEVVVTGSRIRRNPLDEVVPIMEIGVEDLDATGLTNLGDALQDLPVTGSAINSQFNVPGNSGFPQDGSGIGAGAVQLSLRNVGAKRTLILVDGKRWIAGASASGVPSAVDLNTIPANVIERIEILQDGASAIYGSDAIGGVINVITNADFQGFRFETQAGSYISDDDGESLDVSALWGAGNDTTHAVLSVSYAKEKAIETANRSRSAFPNPDATSCDVPGTFCSSFTPQGRFVMGPNFDFASFTLNDGVVNDGMSNIPVIPVFNLDTGDPADPDDDVLVPDYSASDFHAFTGADRFNYNGPGFNFLRTPNERVNIYGSVRHQLSDTVALIARASHTHRDSATKAAPEPLCLGSGCGNRINDNFVISGDNPFNPFGTDLSVANGNLEFFARRPLESGGRLFFQDVNTYFVSTGLEGEWQVGDRSLFWDVTGSYGDNRGFQEKYNSHNAAKLQVAMGDPDVCAATPNCVPFNFFGGQTPPPGGTGTGSITQDMLDFVTYTQRDFSEQTLKDFAFNITGDLADLSAGPMRFAAGYEYRDHSGSFRPDPIAERGETAGIPSGATAGSFDVSELYAELNIPILADAQGADYLEANIAGRQSDYSTSGSEFTYKASVLYRPVSNFSVRGSVSTGLRAPGIGELFGGAAREDFTFMDPCADYTAIVGANNGGRDDPQSATIQANCANPAIDPSGQLAGGVMAGVAQSNPQLSATSAGNANLKAETSDSYVFGLVYDADWVENVGWMDALTGSIDFYNLEIDDAVQGRNPGDVIDACVETLDPFFCNLTPRTSSGQLDVINNQLQNIGRIEASGFDLMVDYRSPETQFGNFGVRINATHLNEYTESTFNADGSLSSTELTGLHTDETFARAFPDWRSVTRVTWNHGPFDGNVAFRWVDEMTTDDGSKLDSVTFTDLQVSYTPEFGDGNMRFTLGFNNLFDEDPPVCFPCGVIGLSTVSHDLPGRVAYIRASYSAGK